MKPPCQEYCILAPICSVDVKIFENSQMLPHYPKQIDQIYVIIKVHLHLINDWSVKYLPDIGNKKKKGASTLQGH